MSVVNLESLSNNDLKKRIASLVSLDDWNDECGQCGRPTLLHKGGPCMRQERESSHVVMKIWSEFGKRAKPIITIMKSDFKKEAEDSLLLEGLKRLLVQISEQNTENMNIIVESLKEG